VGLPGLVGRTFVLYLSRCVGRRCAARRSEDGNLVFGHPVVMDREGGGSMKSMFLLRMTWAALLVLGGCGRAESGSSGTTHDASSGEDTEDASGRDAGKTPADALQDAPSSSEADDVAVNPCLVTTCDGRKVIAPSSGSVSTGGTTANDAGGTCTCIPNEGRPGLVASCVASYCGDSGLCISASGDRVSCQ
jgi:hypothetical protein